MRDVTGKGILCMGSIMVDIVCPVPALPHSGEGVVAEEFSVRLGGCAFNTANIVRQAGGSCSLFAPVGEGLFGTVVRAELTRRGMRGIDTGCGFDSGAAICLVEPDGERTMVTLPGIERQYDRRWADSIDAAAFGVAEVCGYEIDGAGGAEIIAILEGHPEWELVFASGPPTARMDKRKIERLNALHPIWHLNDQEACGLTGVDDVVAAGRAIERECANTVVVTAGAEGAHVFCEGGHLLVASEAIVSVDTIGAGDAHIGAIMALRQRGSSWEDAVAFANRVSAAVCAVEGAELTDAQFAAAVGA